MEEFAKLCRDYPDAVQSYMYGYLEAVKSDYGLDLHGHFAEYMRQSLAEMASDQPDADWRKP